MKRQFIKNIIIAMFPLLLSGGIFAQHDHEFSVYGGGGLSALKYKVTYGDQKLGFGGHFGLGYHFFFSPNWGIGTGAELGFYNSKVSMNNLDVRYGTTDIQGVPFDFISKVNTFKEKQHAMMLQIPLMLQFQTNKPDSKRQFFAAAGGKAGIPLNGKYRTTADLSNAGYYPYENALYDTQTFMGFGDFAGRKANGSLDFKTAFFLSAEAGMKWKLNDKWSLYTGVYVDYGLNNIVETKNFSPLPTIVEYNRANPTEFAMNSIIKSQYISNISSQGTGTPQTIDKITPIAAGIKLRLTFGKNCKQKEAQPEPKITPAPMKETPPVEEKKPEPVVEEKTPEVIVETPKEVVEEKAPIIVEEKAPKVVEEAPKVVDEGMPEAVRRQIEQPVDNYVLNQIDVEGYQKQRLDEKIALLQQYPKVRFHIYGHTCNLGTQEVNEHVGLARAAKAKAYMISKGIAESRILSISSKRDNEPIAPNNSEENRKKNRRVQVVIGAD